MVSILTQNKFIILLLIQSEYKRVDILHLFKMHK